MRDIQPGIGENLGDDQPEALVVFSKHDLMRRHLFDFFPGMVREARRRFRGREPAAFKLTAGLRNRCNSNGRV
jgi:hypothetical protein